MPPKKGKKGVKVVTDLSSFNQQELKKQQEKDFNQGSANAQSQPQSQKASNKTGNSVQSSSQADVNRSEEEVNKFQLSDTDFNIQTFYTVDNKLIDAYYSKLENFTENEKDLLEDSEFLHLIRQISRDLEFILNLRFSQFWGMMWKMPEIQRFLDEFIQNVRKYNDIYKIQFIELSDLSKSQASERVALNNQIKIAMNRLLYLVLRIFYRLTLHHESDDHNFSLAFFQKIVYDHWIFDMAKLIDIAAVYGKSNPLLVQQIINNLFESDKRFVQDFKEGIDLIVTQIKKTFKEYVTIQSMIRGEHIKEMARKELEAHILEYLIDYAELLSNFTLITETFPSKVLDSLRGTNSLIYLANSYCLTLQMRSDLQDKLQIFLPNIKDKQDKNLKKMQGYAFAAEIQTIKKLCMQSTCCILDRVLLSMIGVHVQNFAVVQNQIAQQIKHFVMATTGNSELSKDTLSKNINYISIQGDKETIGTTFLKRIIKRINLLEKIDDIEERFLPDGDKQFLKIVVSSLQQGQKVQVQKINALVKEKNNKNAQNNSQASHNKGDGMTLQDQQNITSLYEMLGSTLKRDICQQIYVKNGKNFEKSLDQLLRGDIPKDEYKVVVIDKIQSEIIDTTTTTAIKQNQKANSELLRQYMVGEFEGSKARATKNRQYYQDHLKAIEQQKYQDEDEDQDVKKKMLFIAGQMQYEDDFDDQNLYLEKNRNREGQKKKRRANDYDSDEDSEEEEAKDKKLGEKIGSGQTKIMQKQGGTGGKRVVTDTQKNPNLTQSTIQQQDGGDDDDEDDDDIEDVEKLLEGFDEDEDVNYMYQEDEKRIKMQQQQEEAKKKEMEKNSNNPRPTGKQQYQQKKEQRDDDRERPSDRDNRDRYDNRGDNRGGYTERGGYSERGGYNQGRGGQQRGGGGQGRGGDNRNKPQDNSRQEYQQKFVPKGQVDDRSDQREPQRSRGDYGNNNDNENRRGGRGGYQQRGDYQGGSRGGYRGGERGGRGRGRGYSDNYQQVDQSKDHYYTSSNPLEGQDLENKYDSNPNQRVIQQNSTYDVPPPKIHHNRNIQYNEDQDQEEGAGESSYRGRGGYRGQSGRGGRGQSRGGFHNQKGANLKKQGAQYPS